MSDPRPGGCQRWPEGRFLLNTSTGELVPGRCRSVNLCEYCARLAAVETAEMLALDAVEGSAPALWVVLTTREATTDVKRFYRSREQMWRAVKRRWPDAEYASLVEFTTGYGPRSGGKRRPHWNLLVKGVPREDLDAFSEIVRRIWCEREDAEPWAQYVGEVQEVGGLMRYIALHFLKESQAPPKGWRGHRFKTSRGYLIRPASEMRQEARRSLRIKRLIWKGYEADAAELEVQLREGEEWKFVGVPVGTADLARRGEGLSDAEHETMLLAAGERDYGGDPLERLADRCREALAIEMWRPARE